MYGRVVKALTLDVTSTDLTTPGFGTNAWLQKQLTQQEVASNKQMTGSRLARIYAMSFEGAFYNLPKPAVFVVHGEGKAVSNPGFASAGTAMDESGLPVREFAWESDIRYWEYDKEDVSLRLDIVAGTLDEILIDATLSAASKYAMTSRAEVAARAELAARAEVAGRAELASRAEVVARHRLR
jgi:hypothetical protein